jgi:two-component system, OmpR family, sensor kinase
LRTPLTALRANADIMLRQIESGLVERADLTEGLSDMRNEVDRMTRLVHNLLILARADVGWRPELTPVDLTVVARDVARIAAPLRRGQMLSLELGAPDADGEDPQVLVKGNGDQLTQLMLVLLDNAFTHTPSGTHVTLGVRRDGQDALLDVMDDGPGISQEHLSRVFERFYRADEARTRTSGGTGLGLSIARWIVAVHGGTIDASSTPGGGATFRVRFNAAEAETTPLPREQPRVAIAPS